METYRAKKSLGQNFLKSVPALNKIIEAGEITKDDIVLEIGPGKGALTSKLLEKAKTVIAVEKDRELFELLKTKFAEEIEKGSFVLINDDILVFDVTKEFPQVLSYKIVANIPYNITGAILKKFLTAKHQPECMILMVQHEVAKRIMDVKGSLLSISVKAYGNPKLIMKVPARYFSPAPKVDSAVIAIKDISRKTFENEQGSRASMDGARHDSAESEEKFWEIVKTGFAHKRKVLAGNLKEVISAEKIATANLGKKRAEELSLKDWIALLKVV